MLTKLDPQQIIRYVYDENSQAYKVSIVGTELSIALSADDNDSVQIVAMTKTLEAGIHSVAGMKVACVYGSPTAIRISPSDEGEDFYLLSFSACIPVAICAKRIQIEGDCKVVVQG